MLAGRLLNPGNDAVGSTPGPGAANDDLQVQHGHMLSLVPGEGPRALTATGFRGDTGKDAIAAANVTPSGLAIRSRPRPYERVHAVTASPAARKSSSAGSA